MVVVVSVPWLVFFFGVDVSTGVIDDGGISVETPLDEAPGNRALVNLVVDSPRSVFPAIIMVEFLFI